MRVATDLHSEATELARRLIRINTVNPPGDERSAVELLAAYLDDAGLECRMFALDPARPNLVARLRGRREGPTLGYLGHVDTVLADPAEWTHDPWSGAIADGFLWGRGALDMKAQVAAEAAAAAALAREGVRPERGDLLLVAVADEEAGGRYGARFLTESHPAQVRCDFLVNEGGGQVIEHRGRRLYPVSCAEKGVFRFTVTTTGVAGHASVPGIADNALVKMAPVLERLARAAPTVAPAEEALELLAALGEPGDPRPAVARLRAGAPELAALVDPMLGMTLAPTRIAASEMVNVIPSRARLEVDCRVPPGIGEAEVRRGVAEALGDARHELTLTETTVGTRSPAHSSLMSAIGTWVGRADPGATVVPVLDPGFTDSHWFRAAFPDCIAYGFFPQPHMPRVQTTALIHGPDERIDLRDLAFATRFFAELPSALLGWSAPARPARAA